MVPKLERSVLILNIINLDITLSTRDIVSVICHMIVYIALFLIVKHLYENLKIQVYF